MRDAHRHDGCRARHEFEPLLAGLQHQPSLLHDVSLVLRMRVKGWRRVSGEEELDQSKAPITRLACDPDDCECAQEPELLAFPRTRPCRTQAAHDPSAYPGSARDPLSDIPERRPTRLRLAIRAQGGPQG